MSQNRPPQSSISGSEPSLSSVVNALSSKESFSTLDILKALYESTLTQGIKDKNLLQSLGDVILSSKQSLADGLLAEDKMAEARNILHNSEIPSRISETSQQLELVLKELNQERHISYDKFEMEFFAMKARIEPLHEEREALKRQYQELINRRKSSLTPWLSDYLEGKVSKSTILKEMQTLQAQEIIDFTKRVDKYLKQSGALQSELDALHSQTWSTLKKKPPHLKQPHKFEVTTPRLGG